MVNIASMDGGYADNVSDGILYRIIECDNVEMFADRGLYLAVCTGGPFYNGDAFIRNERTGEIAANPNFDGASAVFDLPLDAKLADHAKAEQYLESLFPEPGADSGAAEQKAGSKSESLAEPNAESLAESKAEQDAAILQFDDDFGLAAVP
jgi:hypothetical protein